MWLKNLKQSKKVSKKFIQGYKIFMLVVDLSFGFEFSQEGRK